jgi:hypothetical protein
MVIMNNFCSLVSCCIIVLKLTCASEKIAERIEISSIPWSFMRVNSASCADVVDWGITSELGTRVVIKDNKTISDILSEVRKIERDSMNTGIDARTSCLIFYENKVDTLCFGRRKIMFNGKLYNYRKELLLKIAEILPEKDKDFILKRISKEP